MAEGGRLSSTQKYLKIFYYNFTLAVRGESVALGRRMPRANRIFFKKYERKNLEFFTWSWENYISYLSPNLIEKIGFSFFQKNRPHGQETKVIFCSKFFFINIDKTEFSFLINGSEKTSKYQRIHFNEFHDKIIVASNFIYKNMLQYKIGCLGP